LARPRPGFADRSGLDDFTAVFFAAFFAAFLTTVFAAFALRDRPAFFFIGLRVFFTTV
jgi:ABC-type Co2+ transport system permease subunit